MNTRDVGFVFLKLLGLSYLFDAFHHFVNMLMFLNTAMEGDSPRSYAYSSFGALLLSVAFAAILLFLTEPVAELLFHDSHVEKTGASSPTSWLAIGIVLIGVYLVGNNFGHFAYKAGELIWNLGGDRRHFFQFSDWIGGPWWPNTVNSVGAVAIGLVLCFRGYSIAKWFERKGEAAAKPSEAIDDAHKTS